MRVTLLYFDGCPNCRVAEERLEAVNHDVAFDIERIEVVSAAQAIVAGFRGSPTILVDGVDPFATSGEPIGGLSCRLFDTPDGPAGTPTLEQLRRVLGSST